MLSLCRGAWRACPALQPGLSGGGILVNFHTSAFLERARRGTRERKAKLAIANKKKKEERLRRNPPPLPAKIVLMLKSMGLPVTPKPLRQVVKRGRGSNPSIALGTSNLTLY